LLPSSNHPKFIFQNIPMSLFIRIRRICTSLVDYFFHARSLIFQLMKRDYSFETLRKISLTVSKLDQRSLLPYKPKKTLSTTDSFFFRVPFDMNNQNISRTINDSWNHVMKDNTDFRDTRIVLLNQMQVNLNRLLVHNFKLPLKNDFCCKKCGIFNCKLCPFINSSTLFYIKDFPFKLNVNSNCCSDNCIYVIFCKKCNSFYIGETGQQLKARIYSHIYNIKTFHPYLKDFTSVSLHFNMKGHNYLEDFSVLVIQTKLEDIKYRRKLEALYIHLFRLLEVNVINTTSNRMTAKLL
jgi:hypothetical protein